MSLGDFLKLKISNSPATLEKGRRHKAEGDLPTYSAFCLLPSALVYCQAPMDVNLWACWLVKLRMHVRLLAPLALTSLVLISCSQGKSAERRDFDTATVKRQDIEVTASATGVVRPVR